MPTCTKCSTDKPVEMFNRDKQRPTGHHPWCRQCKSASVRAHYVANQERIRADQLWKNRKFRYGITQRQYEALLAAQDGRCAICRRKFDTYSVDHDHACCPMGTRGCGNCVRGLLCTGCNTLLGMANDNPDRLTAAIAYLGAG